MKCVLAWSIGVQVQMDFDDETHSCLTRQDIPSMSDNQLTTIDPLLPVQIPLSCPRRLPPCSKPQRLASRTIEIHE